MNKQTINKVIKVLDKNKIGWSWFNSYFVINKIYLNKMLEIRKEIISIKGIIAYKEKDNTIIIKEQEIKLE